jgi:hypothetical protein
MNPLAVVVYGNGELLLSGVLPDHILIEKLLDLKGFGDLIRRPGRRLDLVVFQNGIADGNALIADICPRVIAGRGDELTNYVLALMAKRTAQSIVGSGTLQAVISCSAFGILLQSQKW